MFLSRQGFLNNVTGTCSSKLLKVTYDQQIMREFWRDLPQRGMYLELRMRHVKARMLEAFLGYKAEDNCLTFSMRALFSENRAKDPFPSHLRTQDPFHPTSKETFWRKGDSCRIPLYKCSSSSSSVSCSVVFNSLQSHRLQPTRFLCPWNFPGKNTLMGCFFLIF